MRHKHANVIHAWAEGAEIEIKNDDDGKWVFQEDPLFYLRCEYRIRPKESEWWENIPEHGVLVKSKNSGQIIAIYSKDMNYALGVSSWTPLTNEEIDRFKR